MAAKRVLGNDPFKRGAAPRVPVATKPVLTPMARPQTPELQTAPAAQAKPVRPTPVVPSVRGAQSRTQETPLAGSSTAPHPGAPGLARDPVRYAQPAPHSVSPGSASGPTRDAHTPLAVGLGASPAPHPGSPGLAADPVRHEHTPSAVGLGASPAPHPASPGLAADPVRHEHTPSAVGLGTSPAAHPASPSLRADPIRHDQTPSAVSLGAGPAAHAQSPSSGADPVSHEAAPTAVALDGAQAHAHSPTAEQAFTRDESAPLAAVSPAAPLLSKEGLVASARGLVKVARALVGRSSSATAVDAWGRDEALVEALRPLADALYEKYWRVTFEGAERIPRGASVIVANHAGAIPIDGPLLHHALRRERPELRPARWLLEDQVFHAPGLGVLWNRLGAVRASPENALQLLAEGTPVVVFPEGFHGLSKPFSERYQLQRFGRGGYVKIAARAGVPIVPIAIVGAEETTPLFGKLPGGALGLPFVPVTLPPLPTRWHLRVGTPVVLDGGPQFADDLAGVQRVNEQVRLQIDDLLKDLLASRPSVF